MPRFEDISDTLQRLARAALDFAPQNFVPRTVLTAGAEQIDARSLNAGYDRLVIVGAAGSGKSALFADLTARAARAFLDQPATLLCPIRVRGADLAKLIRSPDQPVLVHGGHTLALFELKTLLSSGRAKLWLDGWDEIPRDALDHPDLWSLVNTLKRVAITTRPPVHAWFEKWPRFAIAPLEIDEIEQMIARLAPDRRAGQEFLKALALHYDLMDLARSPLLLSMLWRVFEASAGLPTNPATAYAEAIRILVDRWDSKRVTINALGAGERLEFLSHIACEMYALNRLEMYYGEVIEAIRAINHANLPAEAVFEDIATLGLVVLGEDGRFSFVHKSLMMYLVASRFRHAPAGLADLLRRNDNDWRELVEFVGALADRVDDLVDAFLAMNWFTQAGFAFSSGRVRDERLGGRIAARVEHQLGAKFTKHAAQIWSTQTEDQRTVALSQRKFAERRLYHALLDPDLPGYERGRLFEDFAAAFFDGPFRLVSRNVPTLHGEIDLNFERLADTPIWSDLGGQVLVECKNEAASSTTAQVNHFMQKVNNVAGVKLAFFVSRSGVGRHAADAIRIQAANPLRPLVVSVSGEQILGELETPFERESFFVQLISDAKMMRR